MHHEWPQVPVGFLLPSGGREHGFCCPDGISIPAFWDPTALAPYTVLTALGAPVAHSIKLLYLSPTNLFPRLHYMVRFTIAMASLLGAIFCTTCFFHHSDRIWDRAMYRRQHWFCLQDSVGHSEESTVVLTAVRSSWHRLPTSWKSRRLRRQE